MKLTHEQRTIINKAQHHKGYKSYFPLLGLKVSNMGQKVEKLTWKK